MSEHEVYPGAPVVLVALEVRHPIADLLTPAEIRAIKKQLSAVLPLELLGQMANVQVSSGISAPDVSIEGFPRFLNRRKTMSISFRREAVVLEATDYPGWHEFRELVELMLKVRKETAPVTGVERVGIRYINEIRIPNEIGASTWSDWLHPSLLGPSLADIGMPLTQWQGVGIYGTQPGQMLLARYGPRSGAAVDASSGLRRRHPNESGEFFLIDLDSFWTPEEDVPEFEPDMLMLCCDRLHAPIRTSFEAMISERLRDEVLRSDG